MTITDDQARALAAFVYTLRPTRDWDIPGIRAAISNARHRAPAPELAQAIIRLSERVDLRTPAVLREDGPHWPASTPTRDDHRYARCPEPGHTSYAAWNCGACAADRIGTDGPSDPPTSHVDPDVAARGAAAVRAALRSAT